MKDYTAAIFTCLSLLLILSCQNKNKDEKPSPELAEHETTVKKRSKKIAFGYNLADYKFKRDTVTSGDTFGNLMRAQGFTPNEVYKINHRVKDTFDTRKIKTGRPFIIVKNKDKPDEIDAVIYQQDNINYTVINLTDSISAYTGKRPVTTKKRAISGYIESSLSQAMTDANASPALIHTLAGLYQWKIDFFRIQKGDRFKVIFKEKYINDSIYAGIANIDAAEFIHYDEPYYAFRFGEKDDHGYAKFYDENAKTLQNFFLKAPVKYTRISSRYSKRRYHPVQHRYKSHLGTDYAAPTGTPIHSTADGVVIASRYTKYNGNYVKIRHNRKYTTQYLHMSKRKAHRGEHVKQGEVIGYVGQTGLATGPHVCYRFWVNGKQKDPYKQKMPSSDPLVDSLKPRYFKTIKPLKTQLDSIQIKKPKSKDNIAGIMP